MPQRYRLCGVGKKPPLCLIVADPNGAGKTTFAREFLPQEGGMVHFVNSDLIAAGLSPLCPELAALTAGRLFLAELDRLTTAGVDLRRHAATAGAHGELQMKTTRKLSPRTRVINAAMRRAAKQAAVRARAAGTKLYISRGGKVVAVTP
jgi:hypothetical protein